MRIVIIGGGAAGLMAAASALEHNPSASITLIERNDGLGKKVIISGGGRCNVTTGYHDVKEVLTKYPRGGKFLTTAMYNFPPDRVYAWFEEHGVPLKTQTDMRVFPQSDDGHDIVRVFEKLFAKSAVNILLKTSVTHAEKHDDIFSIFTKESPEPILADKLIITTGGQAYRHTGSKGDGYAFAQSLGHTITSLAPSLNAFFTEESWPAGISGLSFEHATITAKRDGSPVFSGPFLFTHKGVSGPAVFALSSLVAFEQYDKQMPLDITIDLYPEKTTEEIVEALSALMQEFSNKQFGNVLGMFLPKSLSEIVIDQLDISVSKRANQVAKKDILRCAQWVKSIPLAVVQRGAGDEFVTAGGVELSEVNPRTMESLKCPGLYFAGEVLNIDGYTGGFNLQASWATGRLAGEHVLNS